MPLAPAGLTTTVAVARRPRASSLVTLARVRRASVTRSVRRSPAATYALARRTLNRFRTKWRRIPNRTRVRRC